MFRAGLGVLKTVQDRVVTYLLKCDRLLRCFFSRLWAYNIIDSLRLVELSQADLFIFLLNLRPPLVNFTLLFRLFEILREVFGGIEFSDLGLKNEVDQWHINII
jgi:hypothetical protein